MGAALAWARDIFTMDVRSLAAWRMAASVLLLADVSGRLRDGDVYALLSDQGVWPSFLAAQWNPYILSLHFINGTTVFQSILLALQGLCALFLLVGFHTRVACVMSWVLLTSLHNRNQMLQDSGDEYFRLLLFCSIFLPLGACFSIDAAFYQSSLDYDGWRKGKRSSRLSNHGWSFTSGWTVAFFAQILTLYWCTAALKTGEVWWNGQAVYYALSLDIFVTRFGLTLLQFPRLMELLTWATIIFEWVGPLMLVYPLQTELMRIVAVFSFCLLHMGFGTCLNLGLFMWIPQAAMLALLPPLFWNSIMQRMRTPARLGLKIYFDREVIFLVRLLATFVVIPETKITPLGDESIGHATTSMHDVADEADLHETEFALSDLEGASVTPSNSTEPPFFRMRPWLIAIDTKGDVTTDYRALMCIFSHSPILFFIPPIISLARYLPCCGIVCDTSQGIECEDQMVENHEDTTSHERLRTNTPRRKNNNNNNNWREDYTGWGHAILAVLFVLFIVNWNASLEPGRPYIETPAFHIVAAVLRLDQFWTMFAPYPLVEDGWWVFPATLQDGTKVDLFKYLITEFTLQGKEDGDTVPYEKPPMLSERYPSQRWAKFFDNLRTDKTDLLKLGLGQYMCREWDRNIGKSIPDKRLQTFKMVFMLELTLPNQQSAPANPQTLWEHEC